MALEFLRRHVIAKLSNPHVPREQAKVHNLCGGYQILLADPPDYEAGADDFARAIDADSSWYLPYENRADAVSYLSQTPTGNDTVRQRESVRLYDVAIKCLDAEEQARSQTDVSPRAAYESRANKRIKRKRAVSQLLSREETLIEASIQYMMPKAECATTELDDDTLYGLASWFAIAARYEHLRQKIPDAACKARCLLAYSLARTENKQLSDWVAKDPDLKAIRGSFGRDQLRALQDALSKDSCVQQRLKGYQFAAAVKRVAECRGWSY